MGYMTTVTILNDAFETIKENPEEFIKNIEKGMNGIKTFDKKMNITLKHSNYFPVGYHCNPMIVAQSHHADIPQLYLVGQNMMTTFGEFNSVENLELRKELLNTAKEIIKREEKLIKIEEDKLNEVL